MLPKISIITPAYNCGRYIERCIQSVINQNYPNFEQIVCDGGSKDGTVEILKKYPHLQWTSEPDNGEVDALNKALPKVTGDFVCWLNADDWLEPEVFVAVARTSFVHPEEHVIYGDTNMVDEVGKLLWVKKSAGGLDLRMLVRWWMHMILFHQPSMFMSTKMIRALGPFDQNLHFSIDLEYWLRIGERFSAWHVDKVFSNATQRSDSKSNDTVPGQIASHWKVVMPYVERMSNEERVNFWLDYYAQRLFEPEPNETSRVPENDDAYLGLLLLLHKVKHAGPDGTLAQLYPNADERAKVTQALESFLSNGGEKSVGKELVRMPF